MLKGGTCMLSELYWCLSGRCLSGLGSDRLSNFSLFRWLRSIWSSISCNTSSSIVNCSKFNEGFTVCGSNEGITFVAIKLTDNPYFLSHNISRYMSKEQKRKNNHQSISHTSVWKWSCICKGNRFFVGVTAKRHLSHLLTTLNIICGSDNRIS